ncbi:hypothetical protein J7I84_21200 [Arthrobacter sp. ISL-85]|uniref:hypothetical protein n=1 Tax=Arthrobacter sp. ISL-85 TaxID=2819115 RepID=UPI001BE7B294|nr:hypothetical protein [Arthrobacter sp. ISL-85]MBT2568958.1 hypothetical protein [Arthrobacter sp. ISL-85]
MLTKLLVRHSKLRAPVLSLASQASGLLQLGVLLWRYGPSNATDAYFYLFNLGNLPIQILIVGVLYPMLLNDDRITKSGARRFEFWVPVATSAAIALGCLWLSIQGRSSLDVLPVYLLAACNAFIQARLWFLAVAAEAEGKPAWMAAVALPANALATLVMLLPWSNSSLTVTAMLTGLVAANVAYLLLMTAQKAGQNVLDNLPRSPARRHTAHWWFLTKSFVGYGGLMVVQSLALVLPPSTLTLLTLPMKIVGSVAATFVNAVMPLLVHQGTDSPSAARRFLKLLVLLLGTAGLLGVIVIYALFPTYAVQAAVVALWLIASASASVAQRLMFRFLPPNSSRITIIVVPLIVVGVAFSASSQKFGLIALLSAYALVDGATSFLILTALRDRLMAVVSGLVSAAIVAFWVTSLI